MIPNLKIFSYNQPFMLESGEILPSLEIGYHTYGTLHANRNNVVWVCHALTANSNVDEWWGKVAGNNGYFHSGEHFIVCANILGSVYGSTNPTSVNPTTGLPYFKTFPVFTMRDIVKAHLLLMEHLGIEEIFIALGGSCGGQQVLEMAVSLKQRLHNMMIIVASARETAWSIAIHTTQRMAIEADCTWKNDELKAGANGLRAARGIGLLGYRTIQAYIETQTDEDDKIDHFKAESYIRYQGDKLEKRFNAHAYWYLTKALDSHHLGRGRGTIEKVLSEIPARALLLSIDSDILIPPSEQQFLAKHLKNSTYHQITSKYGHDGFLIEQDQVVEQLDKFLISHHGI